MSLSIREKTFLLKDTIHQLYCVEGKSLNSIATLLRLHRAVMTPIVKGEWGFVQAKIRQPTPRIQKLLNQHKEAIILYCNTSCERYLTPLLLELKLSTHVFQTLRDNDEELDVAVSRFTSQESEISKKKKRLALKKLQQQQDLEPLPDEEWKEILGYEGLYWVSSEGRVRSTEQILTSHPNVRSGRLCVDLYNREGKRRNLKVYRLVALAFIPNPENLPTVNHKSGDLLDNRKVNLEWATQREQNEHKNKILKRPVAKAFKRNGKFKAIVIDDRFTFKTLKAAAKFLEVSETTIQRYIAGHSKFDREIELIY